VIDYQLPDFKTIITTKQAIGYHLSIGFGKDPTNEKDLKYVYENEPGFHLFPTIITAYPYP